MDATKDLRATLRSSLEDSRASAWGPGWSKGHRERPLRGAPGTSSFRRQEVKPMPKEERVMRADGALDLA